jgi:hypothetical protein
MRQSANAVIIVIGTLLISNATAWCNEVLNSTREQVTQSVRDDVHRKIHEREHAPAVYARPPREEYRR